MEIEVKNNEAVAHETGTLCPNCHHAIPLSIIRTAGVSARIPKGTVYVLQGTTDERKQKVAKMPPQAKTIVKLIESVGTDEISEEQMMTLIADNKDELRTRQDPWRIFQYYRPRLNEAGIFLLRS